MGACEWVRVRGQVDATGTGAMGYLNPAPRAPNNTWQVVVNSIGATSEDRNKYTLRASALQCPLSGCPLPQKPVRASAASAAVTEEGSWGASAATTWALVLGAGLAL